MTGSTSPKFQASAYRVPGVYQAARPRTPSAVPLRTDVAGFIGFEPRVRDSVPASALTGGSPPVGHAFYVDVNAIQLNVHGQRLGVPATPRLPLSQHPASIPVTDGQSIVYAVVAAARLAQVTLIVVAGVAAATGNEPAPTDDAITAVVQTVFNATGWFPWVRIADVSVRRTGANIALTVIPALRATQCDDWNDYIAAFGAPRDDGTLLAQAVRAYFANGGSRCYISTVRRPAFDDQIGVVASGLDMVGVQGSGEQAATGLERLMLIDEVSFVDAPDLHARIGTASTRVIQLPLQLQPPGFRPCSETLAPIVVQQASAVETLGPPLFPADLQSGDPWNDPFIGLQLQMIARCMALPWRMELLLSPPLIPEGDGYLTPDAAAASTWRGIFDSQIKSGAFGTSDLGTATYWAGCVALYYPWLVIQDVVGDPTYNLPPASLAAGVMARRDLARGPAIAPANETLSKVVGVARPIDDATDAMLYSPPPDPRGNAMPAVNIIRPFPGYGIQIWGARTLSTDVWMRFLNVRRAVSAIERRCKAALDQLVFEPNTPVLWAQVTQSVVGVLMPMFEQGGLRGSDPSQAFYVRCDASVNTPDTIAAGQIICEVGVAVAAPAEFIVFRIGQQEGAVQVVE
jgi:uncharacterized protein